MTPHHLRKYVNAAMDKYCTPRRLHVIKQLGPRLYLTRWPTAARVSLPYQLTHETGMKLGDAGTQAGVMRLAKAVLAVPTLRDALASPGGLVAAMDAWREAKRKTPVKTLLRLKKLREDIELEALS